MPDAKTMPPATAIDLIATHFRAVAEPVRLRLVLALGRTERSVSELVLALGTAQGNVSKHLGVLLESGIVGRRRKGMAVLYRVTDDSVFELCDTAYAGLGELPSAQQTAAE
jgi:DNA-binding transcriptional ArsR family regulator